MDSKRKLSSTRIRGRLRHWRDQIRIGFLAARLVLSNLTSSKAVISEHGSAVVSITTHGHRLNSVAIAIESIGIGAVKPSRMILWLEEPEFASCRPANLQRLVRRGLEIRITKPYGPHCKYYSYAVEHPEARLPLVLADDDRFYPRSWLAELLGSYADHPGSVSCYRARAVTMTRRDGRWLMSPFGSWPMCNSSEPSFLTFATATHGVIYPPAVLEQVRNAGDSFLSRTPYSNDIWLHFLALRAAVRTRQIHSHQISIPTIPGTQDIALFRTVNTVEFKDRQIADTYEYEDVARLALELAST